MLFPMLTRLVLLLSLSTLSEAIVCYAPDGTTASPDFQPCIAVDGVESMCCGIARDSNLDVCQPNGLCLNTGKNSFFRDFCTDKTWQSPNCLPKETCSDGTDGETFLEMTQCTDGTWCCGARNFTNCCDQKLGFTLKADLVTFNAQPVTVSATQSSAPTVTVAGIAATSTVTQVVYRTADNASDAPKITSLTIGIVVVGVFGVLGTCAGYWLGRGNWREEKQDDDEKPITANDISWGVTLDLNPLPAHKGPEYSHNVYEVGPPRPSPRPTQPPVELGGGF